ncbi:MAG TPA: CheR family methyltransferase [Conexibacter sp.]|nr:CheR family methyltransferase [Conexibacter sp.]
MSERAPEAAAADAEPLELLLDYLKRSRGFDFTGYKRSSLERRIAKRMDAVEVGDYLAYVDHLEVHPEEFAYLFNTILINVTAFFRDPPAWDCLMNEVIPLLLERKGSEASLRVWCAGCASGEEAYSVAIALAEALGDQEFLRRVKIYATDVDEEALAAARAGSYTAKQVDGVPQALLERYFERTDQRFAFRKDLRRAVIFGRNDLVQDAPISRIDLLVCRNTLMYFNAETQAKILRRFNFGLSPEGFLFLGKSEMLITHADLFTPVNLKRRVFAKVSKPTLRDRLLLAANPHGDDRDVDVAIRESSFDAVAVAQVVTDADGALVLANRRARELFNLSVDDLRRPLREIGLSYRPVELSASIDHAIGERRAVTLGPAAWTSSGGEACELEVQITPLISASTLLGVSVAYVDVTTRQRLQDELDRSKRELETAYEELQSTVEELETTNEELQSTNEELETTNEELQSTNEELETTNEELQSTNEELETINDELRQRTLEVNEVNGFLELILTSLGVAVVVLDRNGVVQIWNAHAEDLWGLRLEEVVGQHMLGLDIGLPVERLRAPLREALKDETYRGELTLPATSRRGKRIDCRVTTLPLSVSNGAVSGVIMLMEQRQPA